MAIPNRQFTSVLPSQGYPEFELGKSRFNQAIYYGRYRHTLELADPRTQLTSAKQLEDCLKLLDDFKKGQHPVGTTDKQLWKAQKIKNAIIHPDTGETMYRVWRVSGFFPYSCLVVAGAVYPTHYLPTIIFMQWLNQTQNAGINYTNRNATKDASPSVFLKAYAGALSVSVAIASSATLLLIKAKTMPPTTKMIIQRLVPYPALALGSVCNLILMRKSELKNGINVQDSKGNVIGTSKIAARKALLKESAVTRLVMPLPIVVVPSIIMRFLDNTKWLKRNPKLAAPLTAVLATVSFAISLPLVIAIYPQHSQIKVSEIEPELRTRTEENEVYYNRGL